MEMSNHLPTYHAGLQESLEKPMAMGSRQQSRWSLPGSREGQEDAPDKGNVIKVRSQGFLKGSCVPQGLCQCCNPSCGPFSGAVYLEQKQMCSVPLT